MPLYHIACFCCSTHTNWMCGGCSKNKKKPKERRGKEEMIKGVMCFCYLSIRIFFAELVFLFLRFHRHSTYIFSESYATFFRCYFRVKITTFYMLNVILSEQIEIAQIISFTQTQKNLRHLRCHEAYNSTKWNAIIKVKQKRKEKKKKKTIFHAVP